MKKIREFFNEQDDIIKVMLITAISLVFLTFIFTIGVVVVIRLT